MNLVVACGNSALRKRWHQLLEDEHQLAEVTHCDALPLQLAASTVTVLLLHTGLCATPVLEHIRTQFPLTRLLFLSDHPSHGEGMHLLHLGGVGYANSYISGPRLREAVRVIGGGGVWIHQDLMQHLIQSTVPHSRPTATGSAQDPLAALSKREQEIALLVAQGLSNLQIAGQLRITERTVKAHLSAIFSKTGSRGRLNLALLINQRA